MPAQSGKSMFASQMGSTLNEAIAKHANDETDYGIIRIPHGIKNGRAQLVEMYFDKYASGPNKDKYYFRAVGVVLSPENVTNEHGTIKCSGLQTSVMEPVCETKTGAGKVTTKEDHIARVLNHMRMLGADTSQCNSAADLEMICNLLVESKPIFKFETSKRNGGTFGGRVQPDGVWENWYGIEGVEAGDVGDATATATQDDTGQPGEDEPNPWAESEDVDALLAACTGDDPDSNACDRLKELAVASGMSQEQADADETTWEALAEFITAASAPADEPWSPKKGNKAYIMVWDKIKKSATKGIEVLIATDPKDGKVMLNDVATGKTLIDPKTGKLMGPVGVSNLSPIPF